MLESRLKALIREIPDFPKPGILFKDITPILADGPSLRAAIDHFEALARESGAEVIAGPESRGFLFGTPLATQMRVGFVPIRKPGKLPFHTRTETYDLEYGQDSLQVHVDAFRPGQKVFLMDDLLATGGTMAACVRLVEAAGAVVSGIGFLIELNALGGRAKLEPKSVFSLLRE